jgi:hypothetical protein
MRTQKSITMAVSTACLMLLLVGCKRSSTPAEETAAAKPADTPAQTATTEEKPAATKPSEAAPPKPKPAETATTETPPKPAAATPPETKPADTPAPPMPTSPRIEEANATKQVFLSKDPELQKFFDDAYGYAIFPSVTKGGLIVHGASGKGVVFEQGRPIGYSTLSQGGIGATIGGQEYSEVVFFETRSDLADFKGGNAKFSAQASAVATTSGASADAAYSDGVLIFTIAKGGLMLEASIGGQGFSFEPLP